MMVNLYEFIMKSHENYNGFSQDRIHVYELLSDYECLRAKRMQKHQDGL